MTEKHVATHQYFRCCGVFEEFEGPHLFAAICKLYYDDALEAAEEGKFITPLIPTEYYVLPTKDVRVILTVQHNIFEADADYFTICLPQSLLELAMSKPPAYLRTMS